MTEAREDVILVQEHRQRGRDSRRRAANEAKDQEWNAALMDAAATERDTSGGIGCIARRGVPMTRLPRDDTPHGARWAPFRVPGKTAGDLTLISVWGYPGEGPSTRNRALLQEVATFAAGLGGSHWLAGGDWNLSPAEFDRADGRTLGTPLVTEEATCYPSNGFPREIDYWVAPAHTRHRVLSVSRWNDSPLPTHRPVRIHLLEDTRPDVPALWMPRAIPDPIIGPQLPWSERDIAPVPATAPPGYTQQLYQRWARAV